MLNKLKQNYTYVFCIGIGFLNFILLAFPYIATFWEYDYGDWGYGKNSGSEGISGYEVMDLWEGGFSGAMSSILQILLLLIGIALLIYGAMGLLKSFGILNVLPDKVANLEIESLGFYGLCGYTVLNVLLFIFLIILTIVNTEKSNEMGFSSASGIRLSAGIFITLIFAVGAVAGLIFVKKKFPTRSELGAQDYFICDKCGKKARAKDKFCNQCGGNIVQKIDRPQNVSEVDCVQNI